MMQDLAMTILDIANNSLAVKAQRIEIEIVDSDAKNLISIEIKDNGKGMSDDQIAQAIDPFYTTRKTRRIGLGIPFFKDLADLCEGSFSLKSDHGVQIYASMRKNHWDRPPMGDLGETISTLIQSDPDVHLILTITTDAETKKFDTEEIKVILEDISIAEPEILFWVKQTVNDLISS
ncbi:MAG: ATP-binding protein [Erysipelotrichaceae bacterium]|nr:ATP-binding protein [Erysipelotrichaceae bacterium]MBQ4343487.1 ATP-binding protein [Erysipelotrichaceae bacterium]